MTETIQQLKENIALLQMKLQKLEELQRTKSPAEEAFRKVYYRYPDKLDDKYGSAWDIFEKGYNASKATEVEPSMTNCVLLGNPPDGYVAWNEWYNEMGSKGILHNLKISSKEYQPTTQERGDRIHKEVENEIEKLQEKNWYVAEENDWKTVALLFGKKLPVIPPYGYDELSPNAWYRWVVFNYDYYIKQRDIESGRYPTPPQTPEQIEKSLKEAFVKAQQTEEWKETQKLIDEKDNDKNFKNSLDLIKEWGEKNKPPTLYQLIENWWCDVFCANSMDDMETCIDGLVDKIEEFLPKEHDTNNYKWNQCIRMIKSKLR